MFQVRHLLEVLESIAPPRFAFGFDRVGLQVGDRDQPVSRVAVSLDRSLAAVEFARQCRANVLLAHHPLLFEPLAAVTPDSHVGRTVIELIRAEIAFIAAHTNWDSAKGGINDALLAALELEFVEDFGAAAPVEQLKMVVFAPVAGGDSIIEAASAAGAGLIGRYSRCAAFAPVTGTFFASDDANPRVGERGKVETVEEIRIEMRLPAERRATVERAVRAAHSYEEPALDFFKLTDLAEQPASRIGKWSAPKPLAEAHRFVQERLGVEVVCWGNPHQMVDTVGVCGGASDSGVFLAQRAGAQMFVTGEVKQHIALEAAESGMAVMAAGHYATEQPGVAWLAERLSALIPEVEFRVFEPAPGFAGRPL